VNQIIGVGWGGGNLNCSKPEGATFWKLDAAAVDDCWESGSGRLAMPPFLASCVAYLIGLGWLGEY